MFLGDVEKGEKFQSFSPQFPQNLVPGEFLVPHLAQVISDGAASGFPQFPQNFIVAGFSVLQF